MLHDLNGQGILRTAGAMRDFVDDAEFHSGPGAVDRNEQVALIRYLLDPLGFKNLFDAPLTNTMMVLRDAVSAYLADNWLKVRRLAKLDGEANLERVLYPGGVHKYSWPGDEVRVFDPEAPIFASECPAMAARVLLKHIIRDVFPALSLTCEEEREFMVYKDDSLYKDVDTSLSVDAFHARCKLRRGNPGKEISVSRLRLGPADKLGAIASIVYEQAQNKGRDELAAKVAPLADKHVKDVARNPVRGLAADLQASAMATRQFKRMMGATGRERAVYRGLALLGHEDTHKKDATGFKTREPL